MNLQQDADLCNKKHTNYSSKDNVSGEICCAFFEINNFINNHFSDVDTILVVDASLSWNLGLILGIESVFKQVSKLSELVSWSNFFSISVDTKRAPHTSYIIARDDSLTLSQSQLLLSIQHLKQLNLQERLL